MNDIKFRAWDKDDKVLRSWEELILEKEDGDDYWMVGHKENKVVTRYHHKQILMQYTGLKDKNGTEIYEGDALGKQGYWGYYVGQKDGAYVAIPLDKIQRINWSWKNIKTCVDVGFVVIGNIYENPELLLEDE